MRRRWAKRALAFALALVMLAGDARFLPAAFAAAGEEAAEPLVTGAAAPATDETPEPAAEDPPVTGAAEPAADGAPELFSGEEPDEPPDGPMKIPLVAGPNGAGVPAALTEDGLCLTLTVEEAGDYAVALLPTSENAAFFVECSVSDADGEYIAGTRCSRDRYGEEWTESLCVYFTAREAGDYILDLYRNWYYEVDEDGCYQESEDALALTVLAYPTIAAPRFSLFGEEEEYGPVSYVSITEPFELSFLDVPADCEVWYCVSTEGWGYEPDSAYTRYAAPIPVNGVCTVSAFCTKETDAGTLRSKTVRCEYYAEVEYVTCSADGLVESGSYVTLSTSDESLTIYYDLTNMSAQQGGDHPGREQDEPAEWTRYTQPILITGDRDDNFRLRAFAETAAGLRGDVNYIWLTIGTPPPSAPVFTPADGSDYSRVEWDEPRTVTLASKEGTQLCYTLNRGSETMLDGNTLTLTVDRDLYVSARAYDPETGMYSDNSVTRSYVVAQPKTLTLTPDAAISSVCTLFSGVEREEYLLNVEQADTYRLMVSCPGISWYSSCAVTLYDAQEQPVRTLYLGENTDVSLAAGTYRLELCYTLGNYGYAEQRCELSIARGVEAPVISPEGGSYDGFVTVTLSQPQDCDIFYYTEYYSNGWHYEDERLYTGPFAVSNDRTYLYAYARRGEARSDTVSAFYRINLPQPRFSPEGGAYNAPVTLTLSHDNPDCEIYYSLSYYDENDDYHSVSDQKYEGPIELTNRSISVNAYARLGDLTSSTAYQTYTIDADAPTLGSGYRFAARVDSGSYSYYNTIYDSAVLAGQVRLKAQYLADSGSGLDHVDYYLKVGDGAYEKLASAPWGEDVAWDTGTVAGSAQGAVRVRLLAVAYDRAGNASASPADLNDGYDADYAPYFMVDNTPCAPADSFAAAPGAGSVTLTWTREKELTYGDSVMIYRSDSAASLGTGEPIATGYNSHSEWDDEINGYVTTDYYYTDAFLDEESAGKDWYYGLVIREARGVESTMKTLGPVQAVTDTEKPTVSFYSLEDGSYVRGDGYAEFYCRDNVSLRRVTAVFIGDDGTEQEANGSPWTYAADYAQESGWFSARFDALSDGAYTLRVTAADVFGNTATEERRFVRDSVAPAATTVTAAPVPGKIDLRWSASDDPDVVGYNVYFSDSEDGRYYQTGYRLTERALTHPNGYDYIAQSYYLEPGAARWFKVETIDRAGNTAMSAPVQGAAGKYNPSLRLVTETPRLGEDVSLVFSGFRDGEYVYLYLDRSEEHFDYEYSYDASAEYSVTLPGSAALRGVHTVRAVGQDSGAVAQLRVAIADLTPTVTLGGATVEQGGSFTAKLDGFPVQRYGTRVDFFLDPTLSGESDSDAYSYTWYYGADDEPQTLYLSSFGDIAPGVYVLRAVEPESGLTALATLTVAARRLTLRCDSEQVAAGEYARFYAGGADSGAALYLNGEFVTDSSYSSGGERYFSVPIPDVSADEGMLLATVLQPATGAQASVAVPLRRSRATLTLPEESVGLAPFEIRGGGFAGESSVKLFVDGAEVRSAYPYSGEVTFTHQFDEAAAAGVHSVELRGATSGLRAMGSVTHTDAAQTLALSGAPTPEQPLTIFAFGFRAGERVDFAVNGDGVTGSGTANERGEAQLAIESLSYAATSYAVTAAGRSSGRTAFLGVGSGGLSLAYTGNIRSGDTVAVTVTDLEAGETADVWVNNRAPEAVTADAAGTATVSYTVPGGFTGSLSVTVRGESSQSWGVASIPVNGYEPTLAVAPGTVAAGDTLTATVGAYRPGAALTLCWDGRAVGDPVTVAADGAAALPYTIPVNAAGVHSLAVFDPVSGLLLEREITASAASPTLLVPETAVPGETVTLGAAGLAAGETVRISVDGTLAAVLTEADGAVSTDYTLPVNAAAGDRSVTFALERSAVLAEAAFTVAVPTAAAEADMTADGSAIVLSASGFLPGETLSVYFDNRDVCAELETHAADENGCLRVTFTPGVDTVAGEHTFNVFGRRSMRRADASVSVPELGPVLSIMGAAEGRAGDTLRYAGANFAEGGAYALYFESELLEEGAADGFGVIAGEFAIPGGYADGRYQLLANDQLSGKTAVCHLRLDTTAPAAPTLTAVPRKQAVALSWTPPADEDIASYTLYVRPEGVGEYTELVTLDRGVTSWTHDMRSETFPLTGGARYEYTVTATDRLGQEGERAAVMSVMLADGGEAPNVSYGYANTGNSVTVGGEWLYTVRGRENRVYLSASDDQMVAAMELVAVSELGAETSLGVIEPRYGGSYGGSASYWGESAVDTALLADGVYTFRFIAADSAGRTGSYERRYYVDNTPPAAVTSLRASGGSNSLYVSWTPAASGDADRYRVAYGTDAAFAEYTETYVYPYDGARSCTLRGLAPDTVYYVRVTAIDAAGNESPFAEVSGTPIVDDEKPVITVVNADAKLGKSVSFSVEATDNAELDWSTLTAEINAGEGGAFIPFGSTYWGGVYADGLTYNGQYTLRFRVGDRSGNVSDDFTITREIDTRVSTVTGLTAMSAAGSVRLSWDRVRDNDLANYCVYRAEGDGAFRSRNWLSPLKITVGDTVTWYDYAVEEGVEYRYKIVAADDVYNYGSLEETAAASATRGSYAASMTLSPTENVAPGAVLHVSAEGFRGGEYVAGRIDALEDEVFWTYADDEGRVSTDWSYVRETGAGEHTLHLRGYTSNATADATFTCKPAVLSAPGGLDSTPGMMELSLRWSAVEGASYYRVYRAEEGAEATLLADRVYGTSYTDRTVGVSGSVGRVYVYAVSAVDRYGSEGARSDTTTNRPDPDTTDPELSVFTFQRTGDELRLIAEATDDLRLRSVVFRYKNASAPDADYVLVAEVPVTDGARKTTATATLDVSALADGSYTLAAQAVDGALRVSAPMTRTFLASSAAPNAPESLRADAGQMRVNLGWREATEQNLRPDRALQRLPHGGGGGLRLPRLHDPDLLRRRRRVAGHGVPLQGHRRQRRRGGERRRADRRRDAAGGHGEPRDRGLPHPGWDAARRDAVPCRLRLRQRRGGSCRFLPRRRRRRNPAGYVRQGLADGQHRRLRRRGRPQLPRPRL